MKATIILTLVLIILSFAIGAYVYPQMPDKMITHWDVNGQPNGYMQKFWGLFFVPLLMVVLVGFFMLIPHIDPLRQNIKQFRRYYDGFVLLFTAFMFYVYLLSIFANLGYKFGFTQMLSPTFGVLFYYLGVLTGNAKRNWFIGIRTPWTLSSDVIWEKTNKLGGRLFKIAGIIAFLGVLFPGYELFFLLVPVLAVAAYTVIYSYLEFQKESSSKRI